MNHPFDSLTPQKFPPNLYWLQWMSGTAIAFLISLRWLEVGEPPDLGTLQGILGGTIIGLSQALILSPWFPQSWLWIIATLIPWGLMASSPIGAIGWIAPRTDSLTVRLMVGAMLGAITGLWVGSWQWLVLRQKLSGSLVWIVVSSLSWSLALSLGWAIGGILRLKTRLFLAEVIGLGITWILVGIPTGMVLGNLLQKKFSRQKPSNFPKV